MSSIGTQKKSCRRRGRWVEPVVTVQMASADKLNPANPCAHLSPEARLKVIRKLCAEIAVSLIEEGEERR